MNKHTQNTAYKYNGKKENPTSIKTIFKEKENDIIPQK
jgi:hypothetical protein